MGTREDFLTAVQRLARQIADRWLRQFGKNAPILPRWRRILWCWAGTASAVLVFTVGNESIVDSLQQGRTGSVEAVRQATELWHTDLWFFIGVTAGISLILALACSGSFNRGTPLALILASVTSTAVIILTLRAFLN